MDLLAILRKRLDALPPGDYHAGLRAVVQHVAVATSHLTRGATQADDTAFTDAIYRTNQAFEGSLKEAYRVLTGSDPVKKSPFEIESFLQEQSILRGRVISQLSNYRKEWRNPSTHDYRLDFDEDEALLAIVSVCAFAIVLIDQIAEKVSFDTARARSQPVASPTGDATPLVERVAEAVARFEIEPAVPRPQDFAREAEVVGSLAGFLTVALPKATVDLEPRFGTSVSVRPDMVISMGQQRVLVEVKRAPQHLRPLQQQYMAQMAHYIAASGIKAAIVYVHSEHRGGEPTRKEHELPGVGARVIVISRT